MSNPNKLNMKAVKMFIDTFRNIHYLEDAGIAYNMSMSEKANMLNAFLHLTGFLKNTDEIKYMLVDVEYGCYLKRFKQPTPKKAGVRLITYIPEGRIQKAISIIDDVFISSTSAEFYEAVNNAMTELLINGEQKQG